MGRYLVRLPRAHWHMRAEEGGHFCIVRGRDKRRPNWPGGDRIDANVFRNQGLCQ
jgi:hypothetical protein